MAAKPIEVPVLNDAFDFDGGASPLNTAWVKWNVKKGDDRTEEPQIGVIYELKGQPSIQGIEIKSSADVTVSCWIDLTENGSPNITVGGPTDGQRKIDPPRRLGSYRIDYRKLNV
ncbi:hypothetical protein GGI43DRAFT_433607 [Trichoderma evansii]